MEIYDSLVALTHEHVGHYISDALSLDKTQELYVSQGLLTFSGLFILLQLISLLGSLGGGKSSSTKTSASKSNVGAAATSRK